MAFCRIPRRRIVRHILNFLKDYKLVCPFHSYHFCLHTVRRGCVVAPFINHSLGYSEVIFFSLPQAHSKLAKWRKRAVSKPCLYSTRIPWLFIQLVISFVPIMLDFRLTPMKFNANEMSMKLTAGIIYSIKSYVFQDRSRKSRVVLFLLHDLRN
jgi:hypothetical protein